MLRATPASFIMWPCWLAAAAAAGGAGCWHDVELPDNNGSLGGQVVVSGSLRGARVSVDLLDLRTGEVRIHVGDTITDADGRFALDTGTANGVLRVVARGGTYEDLATGATVELDDTDELRALIRYEILDLRDDA